MMDGRIQEKDTCKPFNLVLLKAIRDDLRAKIAPEAASAVARGTIGMIDAMLNWLITDYADAPAIAAADYARQQAVLRSALTLAAEFGALKAADAAEAQALAAETGVVAELRPRQRALLDRLTASIFAASLASPELQPRTDEFLAELIAGNQQRQAALQAANTAHNAAPSEKPAALQLNAARLEAYLRRRFPEKTAIAVTDFRVLPGGFSKATLLFEITGLEAAPTALVLRVDQPSGPTGTTVVDEYPVLEAMFQAGLPVPETLWLEADPAALGAPFIVMRRVAGATAGEIGQADPAICNAETARDLARVLAKLHLLNLATLPLTANWQAVRTPRDAVLQMIETFEALYLRRRREPDPVMLASLAWLKQNIPTASSRVSLVHADLGFPNFLVHDRRLTAILDWELAHPGDAAEDLSYIRPYIEQILPWPEFMALYRAQGGSELPEQSAEFYDIWRTVRNAIYAIACIDGFVQDPAAGVMFAFGGLNYYERHMQYATGKISAIAKEASKAAAA